MCFLCMWGAGGDFISLGTLNCLLLCLCTLSESILKATSHSLQITHTSGTIRSTTLSLGTPIVLSHLLSGITTRRTASLLDVVTNLTTSTAGSMRLIVSLTE